MNLQKRLIILFKNWFKNFNIVLLITTLLLVCIGIISIYSATGGTTNEIFIKQIIWYLIGLVVLLIFSNINYNNLITLANYFYYFFLFLLVLVLVFGYVALGAQRWLRFGVFQFQPSEFMKIIVPLVVIRYILIKRDESWTLKSLMKIFLITLIPMLLILKQPDLGTAIIIIPLVLVVLFIGNIPIKKFVSIIVILILIIPVGYVGLKDYQKQRLLVFINPQVDPLGAGYNVIQSKIAIGSGKFFGRGWLRGPQSQLNFIPIKYTDFIFSVICEEFGFIGGLFVVLIYYILIMEILKISKLCKFTGGKILASVIAMIILVQFFINIGMTIGLLPVTGLTLPLLSYGGSSIVFIMIIIGIAQNIYREYMKGEEI
ncbi:MAG: rod shape-determining protein RodA [Candidatus Goldbacteria bacterium]|nr:rod shape-determining protein RodA [Candidatus Goldiibacteriota bacterium]